jgi:septum formation protein
MMTKHPTRLILASGSPRRRQLLSDAGYEFEVIEPGAAAECGICSRETPPETVGRLAYQKAGDVARRCEDAIVIGADTVAECCGQILGKPADERHAREMLNLLRGREHQVFTGICLWQRPGDETIVRVDVTKLQMDDVSEEQVDAYLDTGDWKGKAGAFGYQDQHDWLRIIEGSESNVVGLPMEMLAEMLTLLSS